VTWGPLCPGPTRTSRVSPGCTVLMSLRASTLPWRKASPDPSDSSTKPNPFSGLNHLTTARTGGPEGVSKGVRFNLGRVPKAATPGRLRPVPGRPRSRNDRVTEQLSVGVPRLVSAAAPLSGSLVPDRGSGSASRPPGGPSNRRGWGCFDQNAT
jgi:hypothetical protein